MKCSLCNSEMSPSGICPVCGNEVKRSRIAQTSESSGSMDFDWIINMEKARNIGGFLNWIGIGMGFIGICLMKGLEDNTLGMVFLIIGGALYLAYMIYTGNKNRCPSCKCWMGFGNKHRERWERYSSCPKCGKALYGHLADEDRVDTW